MHIIAVCPFCQTSYQVQPTLRGQPIRCPNTACRKVFMIAPEPPAARGPTAQGSTPPGNGNQQSGSVGEMVPILPAESAAPVAEPKPADGDWWQGPPVRQAPSQPAARPPAAPSPPPATPTAPAPSQAPWWGDAPPPVRAPQAKAEATAEAPPQAPKPRRRRSAAESLATTPAKPAKETAPRSVSQTQPMPALTPEQTAQPRELPPGVWEPPPVRRGPDATNAEDQQPASEATAVETHRPVVSKRRARWLIAVMVLVPLAILGGVGVLVWMALHKSENALFTEAKGAYEQAHYSDAASKFRQLAETFPNSERAPEYRFLQDWSAECGAVADPGDNLSGAVEKLDEFIKKHKKDPLMVQYGHDAGQLLVRLTKTFAESNSAPTSDKPLAVAERIVQLRRTVEGLGSESLGQTEGAQIDSDLGKVRLAVRRWRERRDVLSQLSQHTKETPFDAIKRGRALLEQKKGVVPGLDEDAEARAALTRLYDAHLASVVYQPQGEEVKGGNAPRLDDDAPSLLFAPLLSSAAPGNAPVDDPIVLALARGVLYALKQSNGELKWATRVGVDTTVLPLRLPFRLGRPELILVLSADTQTLTALRTDGGVEWEYPIGQPVLGRPVVIEQRAYLAAYDGWVHEIELSQGKPIGRYSLGQRLTRGGTREGDSSRIYFPADDSCIYVLDVQQKRCVNILYDGHPSGSLRSEPIVVPPERREAAGGEAAGVPVEDSETPGFLILNQASGLDAMSLRVFQLPLRDRHAAPLDLNPPARLNGWTWFEPYHDSEKVVVLSDAGILGLFGIKQVGNRDQALFPLLKPGGLDLSPFLRAGADVLPARGRAQVVHVQDNDLWILAHGRLQQVQLLWNDAVGPRAVAGWPKPLRLGSPLHAPQRIEDRDGRSTFFLVTQPLDQQTCIASKVNDDGRILWQRQLGLVFQGEPLALTPPQGGAPMLLALDQGGGLFALDPSQKDRSRSIWQSLAPALDDNPRMPPRLLPAPDGHSAYEVAVPGDGTKLIVRRVTWEADERRLRLQPLPEVSLLSEDGKKPLVPAGAPALVGEQLIVPMVEGGDLVRVLLAEAERQDQRKTGPSWRSNRAAPNAPCYVLALGGDRFLVTDGSRGLAVWEWPANREWRGLPEGRDQPATLLPYPVAAPPILLPSKAGQAPRVVVADSAGTLQLLTVSPDGSLQPTRSWDLKGRLTAAPFARQLPDGGVRVGCLLDERHLVWLDPAREETLWTYRTDGEAIVGRPQMIEGLLVAALQSGRYVALDPATGESKGPGYTLRASAAPAASPVSFGPGRMLAPLSDGTALLLSPKLLGEPKR
ncbi:MAG TPA: PQQ-binding-like beta-propeller repeat protein [Gemmataceae bacterium]